MANGLAPYILNDIKNVAGQATTRFKVDMHGFLAMLVNNAQANPIQTITSEGNKKEVRIRYRQRNTKAQTDTTASCDNVLTPARKETTLTVGNTRQIAWHLTDALVAQYEAEALARTNLPGSSPLTGVSAELMDIVFSGANGILDGMNDDLLALLTFGRNAATGASTAQTINFPQTITAQPLNNGVTKLLYDYKRNNLTGRPQVVGAGFALQWFLQQAYKGLDTGGIDTKIAAGMMDFWPDQDFDDIVGTNHFGIFEPGSVHLVEALEYVGAFAGSKPGASTFGTIPVPAIDALGNAMPVMFDFQLKYIDCPTTLTDAYSGNTATKILRSP